MKYRILSKWTDPVASEGLVFFAQLLEELLFDYSLDTYKPSAMNSSTLCIEARRLIRDIEDDVIDKNNLDHVLKELVLNLRKDPIAKSLLTIKIESLANKFENKDTPIQEVAILIEVLYSLINLKAYKDRTEHLLIQAVKLPKEKDLIRSLTRSYVTTLINCGYSTRFLYPTARTFFYWSKQKITSPEYLKDFFKIVAGVSQNYTAVFRVNSLFDEIKDSCQALDIEVTSVLNNDLSPYVNNKSFELSCK